MWEKYRKLINAIMLINIAIPFLYKLVIKPFISIDVNFSVAMFIFTTVQILNLTQYKRRYIVFIYLIILNFLGLILVGEISIFFALSSALRIYLT